MEKIVDKIAALPADATFFSLEFFPPKTEAGQDHLQARLSRMSRALRPTFVNVTWGAGGSTAGKSLELAELCQRQLGLTTCLHLTCTNMERSLLDTTLRRCKDIGIRNILALRGDPPRRYEYGLDSINETSPNDTFVWAADLVRYVRKEYGDYFCIGVAGYPEGHSDESNPSSTSQSVENDLPYLAEKVQAGADFIMTQMFYDVEAYLAYEKKVVAYRDGMLARFPIIPGLMPVQNFSALKRIAKLSHANIPSDLLGRLEKSKNDDGEVKKIGIDILIDIVGTIKSKTSQAVPRGFHFYTLNLEKSISFIVERCHLIPPLSSPDYENVSAVQDETIAFPVSNGHNDNSTIEYGSPTSNGSLLSKSAPTFRRPSSPRNHRADDGSNASTEPPSRATMLAITHGMGSLGREATWDDFPNGRFGDARSPAFGEIDGYGPSIHMSPASARQFWGSPQSQSDLKALFLRHVRGELNILPWIEDPVSAETKVIENKLCNLIEKGWLSIASQPALDATDSADPVFGWGPRGGFVFQKAFVEMFVPRADWSRLRSALAKSAALNKISWYATACISPGCTHDTEHFEASDPKGSANSVTWGAFPGKEIATPTIIEEISFKAWAEEAFNLWAEWERCYSMDSTRKFLRRCREELYLVNVIGHSFKNPSELWDILLVA